MSIRKKFALLIFLLGLPFASKAQDVALKTNLIYDALLSPTLGLEVGLAPKWSLDISGTFNAWNIDERRWRQWMVQPEARYWFCRRFAGHFVALHGIGGQYNFGNIDLPFKFLGTDFRQLKDHRLQGWMAGAGIGYGYSWIIDRHWNLEAEIGIGWIYTRYDEFNCIGCGKKISEDKPHNYVGPTKAAVSLIYVF